MGVYQEIKESLIREKIDSVGEQEFSGTFDNEPIGIEAKLIIRKGSYTALLPIDDLLFFHSQNRKVDVHLKSGMITLHSVSLREIAEQLPYRRFFQTHRAFIINLSYLRKIASECVYLINKNDCLSITKIKISRQRKKELIELLRTKNEIDIERMQIDIRKKEYCTFDFYARRIGRKKEDILQDFIMDLFGTNNNGYNSNLRDTLTAWVFNRYGKEI